MVCQPKSVGKIADFENFTLFISLNSGQMCTYFCKYFVTGHCLYLVKILFQTVIRFQTDFNTHTLLLWSRGHVKMCVLTSMAPYPRRALNL